jgi:hypothetical protein
LPGLEEASERQNGGTMRRQSCAAVEPNRGGTMTALYGEHHRALQSIFEAAPSLARLLLPALAASWLCTAATAAEGPPSPPAVSLAYAKPLPKLAVLEPELEGDLEDASRVPGWQRKMAALNDFLRQQLAERNLYTVLSNEPAADLIERDQARRQVYDCLPCIQDVAQRLGADRVLVVWVFRDEAGGPFST